MDLTPLMALLGAVVAGLTADSLGLKGAMWFVAGITFLSGVIVGVRMDETLRRRMESGD